MSSLNSMSERTSSSDMNGSEGESGGGDVASSALCESNQSQKKDSPTNSSFLRMDSSGLYHCGGGGDTQTDSGCVQQVSDELRQSLAAEAQPEQVILTLEPLPEDQLQELTAGGEVRVGVRHDPSIRLQVQDAHWGEGEGHAN
ncbi:hypothetical protein EYF80_041182 [Liparis tanakae]|uniref:Uncharacterized protein n=1 Tax=Liparis tanakae TaxID=230148 RepID=A0A4Z2G764_9TELE|nr:hypothetical protein EYF80_041182 [Liparis tanakae]